MIEEFAEINCEAYGLPVESGRSALEPKLWIEESYSYLGFENDRAVRQPPVRLDPAIGLCPKSDPTRLTVHLV